MSDPPVQRNQPKQLPRFGPAENFPISRGKFTGGTFPVGWGPGQDHYEEPGDYFPPTDWPRAGMVLRMPQVVWLAVELNTDRWFDGATHPSPYVAVTEDLVATFAAVKAAIETLRPGKTWVSVLDNRLITTLVSPPQNLYFGFSPMPHLAADFPGSEGTTPRGVAGPLAEFLGTNFLQVICLDPLIEHGAALADDGETEVRIHYTGPPELPDLVDYPFGDSFPPLYDPTYADQAIAQTFLQMAAGHINQWRSSFARFAGYRVIAYGPAGDYEANLDNEIWTGDATRALVSDVVADMAAQGFAYSYAGTSDDINADALVAAIAAHFGFDPSTGDDL